MWIRTSIVAGAINHRLLCGNINKSFSCHRIPDVPYKRIIMVCLSRPSTPLLGKTCLDTEVLLFRDEVCGWPRFPEHNIYTPNGFISWYLYRLATTYDTEIIRIPTRTLQLGIFKMLYQTVKLIESLKMVSIRKDDG